MTFSAAVFKFPVPKDLSRQWVSPTVRQRQNVHCIQLGFHYSDSRKVQPLSKQFSERFFSYPVQNAGHPHTPPSLQADAKTRNDLWDSKVVLLLPVK